MWALFEAIMTSFAALGKLWRRMPATPTPAVPAPPAPPTPRVARPTTLDVNAKPFKLRPVMCSIINTKTMRGTLLVPPRFSRSAEKIVDVALMRRVRVCIGRVAEIDEPNVVRDLAQECVRIGPVDMIDICPIRKTLLANIQFREPKDAVKFLATTQYSRAWLKRTINVRHCPEADVVPIYDYRLTGTDTNNHRTIWIAEASKWSNWHIGRPLCETITCYDVRIMHYASDASVILNIFKSAGAMGGFVGNVVAE